MPMVKHMKSMARISFWIHCLAVFIGYIGGGSFEAIPMCYVPVKLAYDVKEPLGGANETLAPIIFLHGASTSKEYWFDMPQNVADRTKRRVFNLDARNHGDSEWSDIYNYDMNAQDLVNFMNSKSIPKAILIGHSMGGITAIKVPLSHPQRVEMAFIEDMYVKRVPREIQQHVIDCLRLIEEAVAQVPTDLNETAANQFVLEKLGENLAVISALGASKRQTSSKRYIAMKRGDDGRYKMKCNLRALTNALRTEEALMSENKGVYGGPAYFIYGTESAFKVGDEQDHIRHHFPNAIFVGVEGVNHEVRLSVPEEFTDAVVNGILGNQA